MLRSGARGHRMAPLSRLKAPLEQLCREADWARRIDRDAIRYPLRYPDPADREIVALLSACLAYGRVDLFGPWIEWALARMGESPHRFVLGFDPTAHARIFDGFHYRFNRAHDLVAFCLSGRRVLSEHGSLGAFFTRGFERGGGRVGPALETFVEGFVDGDLSGVFPRNQLSYGYRHWFPRPSTGGASARPATTRRSLLSRIQHGAASRSARLSGAGGSVSALAASAAPGAAARRVSRASRNPARLRLRRDRLARDPDVSQRDARRGRRRLRRSR